MQLILVASITHRATTQEALPWLGLAECKEAAPQEQHSGHSPWALIICLGLQNTGPC